MNADFSRGFKVESPDGMTDTTKIYDSKGEAVSMVKRFELVLDSENTLPTINISFHPGMETVRERMEEAIKDDPELAEKIRAAQQVAQDAAVSDMAAKLGVPVE